MIWGERSNFLTMSTTLCRTYDQFCATAKKYKACESFISVRHIIVWERSNLLTLSMTMLIISFDIAPPNIEVTFDIFFVTSTEKNLGTNKKLIITWYFELLHKSKVCVLVQKPYLSQILMKIEDYIKLLYTDLTNHFELFQRCLCLWHSQIYISS